MKRIGLYTHNNNFIELFFNEDTLEFEATWDAITSPRYSNPKEALNFCRTSIEIDVAYEFEIKGFKSVYKKFINPNDIKIVSELDELDKEMWSLDYNFAKWALPRVLYFKVFCSEYGTPGDFVDIDKQGNHIVYYEEWEEVLTEIITALRLIIEDCASVEENVNGKINRGLMLFSKYIRAMWT